MSKVWYDHLIILEEVEVELDKLEMDRDERREMEHLIEEMIHHRVMDRVLTHLPRKHHEEFLSRFTKTPHDPALIHYLDEKIEASVEKHVKDEMSKLKREIFNDLRK